MSYFIGRHEKKREGSNRNTLICHVYPLYWWLINVYCHRLSGAVECTLPNPLETGVQVRLMSSVGRLLSLFHANYKVKYNLCDDFIWCLDGALLSSVVYTLNSSCSDPCQNVDRGAIVIFYWSSWKKAYGVTLSFFIGRHEKKHKGYTCRFLLVVMKKSIRGNSVVFYWSSWKKT